MTNEKIEEKVEQLFIKTEHELALIASISEIFNNFTSTEKSKSLNTICNLIDVLSEKVTDSNSIAGSVLSDLATLNTERR